MQHLLICLTIILWYRLAQAWIDLELPDSCSIPSANDMLKGDSLLQKHAASQGNRLQKAAGTQLPYQNSTITALTSATLLGVNESGNVSAPPSAVATATNDDYIHDDNMGLGDPPSSQLRPAQPDQIVTHRPHETNRAHSQSRGHEGLASDGEHGHGKRRSIFTLKFEELDSSKFWIIMASMLVFTIGIDRAEYAAATASKTSAMEKEFLNRINAELMMFGCVGLALFIVNKVVELSEDTHILIEFIDILCSLGAVGMIVIAAMLYCTRYYNDREWHRLEGYQLDSASLRSSGVADRGFLNKCIWGPLQPADYQVLAEHFRHVHKLPVEFRYCQYLNLCLLRNACDLMDIHWTSWVSLLTLASIFLGASFYRQHPLHPLNYAVWFIVACCSCLFCFIAILCFVNWVFERMMVCAAHYIASPDKVFTEDDIPHPVSKRFGDRMRFLLQVVSLLSSFFIALYVMHVRYNLISSEYGFGRRWHPLAVGPQLICLLVILPLAMTRFSMCEAFFTPNSEAIDETLQELSQAEEDLDYVRRSWRRQGSPAFPRPGEGVSGLDEKGLTQVLRSLGLHLSAARIRRIFEVLDEDRSGSVDSHELYKQLLEERREGFQQDVKRQPRRQFFRR